MFGKTLNIAENKKVILYAPTFRDYEKWQKFVMENEINFEQFEEKTW